MRTSAPTDRKIAALRVDHRQCILLTVGPVSGQKGVHLTEQIMATAPIKSESQKPVAVIDERQDASAKYKIITAGEDIISRTAAQLASASRLQVSAEVWADNCWRMIEHVRDWANQHAEKLRRIVVEFRTDKLVFGIVSQSETYDFDLGFEQAELDIHLNTRGNIGYVETRQIPHWDERTFICDGARLVWPVDESKS